MKQTAAVFQKRKAAAVYVYGGYRLFASLLKEDMEGTEAIEKAWSCDTLYKQGGRPMV